MVTFMKYIFFCLTLLSVTACASQTAKFSDAKITGAGSDKPNSLCQNFQLTDQEAVTFFTKAKQVSAIEIHDQYDYLPCYVKGTIAIKKASSPQKAICDFNIRAGGTAELTCNNEETVFYGCKTCDKLLQDKN